MSVLFPPHRHTARLACWLWCMRSTIREAEPLRTRRRSGSLPLAMGDGVVWEPSTKKEKAHYDKLFMVIDRDKSGTLDGKEAVQFLRHSGLTNDQLKNVWSVACTPGQAVLERHEFYVAMRLVALAQGGEATLTKQRVRDTATNSIAIATFTGLPSPSITFSKGKKNQKKKKAKTVKELPKSVSKNTSTRKETDTRSASEPVISSAPEKEEHNLGEEGNKVRSTNMTVPSARPKKGNTAGEEKDSKGNAHNGTAADSIEDMTIPKRTSKSGSDSSSSASGETLDSDEESQESSRSWGEKSGNSQHDEDNTEGSQDRDGTSDSDSSGSKYGATRRGKSQARNRRREEERGEGDGDDCTDDEEDTDGKAGSSRTLSTSDSSAGPSKKLGGDGGVDGGGGGSTTTAGSDKDSLQPSSASCTSLSSSCQEDNSDHFQISAKARAKYNAIFSKLDASGTGSLSQKRVRGLFSKSGLDNSDFDAIWRLSDLNEDGRLSAEEFALAFHLTVCVTQRNLGGPDELHSSLKPAGYVLPSILAGRKEKAEPRCKKEEREHLEKKEIVADTTATMEKKKQGMSTAGANEQDGKAACRAGHNSKAQEKEEDNRYEEKATREATSIQKSEGLAKKCSQENTKKKGNRSRTTKKLLAATSVSELPLAGDKGGMSPTSTASTPNAEANADDQGDQTEGTPTTDIPAAVVEGASPRFGTSGSGVADCDEHGAPTKKARSYQQSSPRLSNTPHDMAERPDIDDDGVSDSEIHTAVRPLTMKERRMKKAKLRAAKQEAAKLKKEIAVKDARLEELAREDIPKAFNLKAMEPMPAPENSGSLYMLPDPGGKGDGDGRGALSFSRLSAPLPYLTPQPGRPPCIKPQEFSVSFPSGVRRASSLTPSLDIRLGPPPAPLQSDADGGGPIDEDAEGDGLIRCPKCAVILTSTQIVQHIRSTCRLLPCELCSCLLLPVDRERHLEGTCPNRRTNCTRCGESVVLSEFARHEMEGGCVRRVVSCSTCGEFCFADELAAHEASECPERDVRCSSCGDILAARCMAEHASSLCRRTTWTCTCGEGPFPFIDRPTHLKTCEAFIDAWEASIEKAIAQTPKIEVIRNIGKIMLSTRVEDPAVVLLALAENMGDSTLAAKKMTDGSAGRAYMGELCLAADIVNVNMFLNALNKPGKRGSGALWRAGLP